MRFLQILEFYDIVVFAEPVEVNKLFKNLTNDSGNFSLVHNVIWPPLSTYSPPPPLLPLAVVHELPREVDAWAQNLVDDSGAFSHLQIHFRLPLPTYPPSFTSHCLNTYKFEFAYG